VRLSRSSVIAHPRNHRTSAAAFACLFRQQSGGPACRSCTLLPDGPHRTSRGGHRERGGILPRRLGHEHPETNLAEALETTRIHSVTGGRTAVVTIRPCRAPYQIMSDVGLIGGGQVPMPGEVSGAHDGMLLLDARPECRWHVLEGCASRLRTALQESNLASVLDLTALATLAMRGMTSVGSRKPGSTPR
jgi:hypothetical protein